MGIFWAPAFNISAPRMCGIEWKRLRMKCWAKQKWGETIQIEFNWLKKGVLSLIFFPRKFTMLKEDFEEELDYVIKFLLENIIILLYPTLVWWEIYQGLKSLGVWVSTLYQHDPVSKLWAIC